MKCNQKSFSLLDLQSHIQHGLEFLSKKQMSYGEFSTYLSNDKNIEADATYISSVYITSFILYSISFIKSPLVSEITRKAVNFLVEEMEPHGVWRFFCTNRDVKYVKGKMFVQYTQFGIVPDLDDIACVRWCLEKNGVKCDCSMEIFSQNLNSDGMYLTWLTDIEKRKEYGADTMYLVPSKNDTCIGVNANILLYMGENNKTAGMVNRLNSVVAEDREAEALVHFHDKIIFYYLLSRAYFNGAVSLGKSKDLIIGKLLSMQQENGSFGGAMYTALAASILMNFNYTGAPLDKAVEHIVESRSEAGFWPKYAFYKSLDYVKNKGTAFYGSDELSTAFCIEALSRYLALRAV